MAEVKKELTFHSHSLASPLCRYRLRNEKYESQAKGHLRFVRPLATEGRSRSLGYGSVRKPIQEVSQDIKI